MEKKRLDLDDVKVEAFEMEGELAGQRGTVFGQRPTVDISCSCEFNCDFDSGYQYSCNDTWCPGTYCLLFCRTDEPPCSP
jgi:hypothetical protein